METRLHTEFSPLERAINTYQMLPAVKDLFVTLAMYEQAAAVMKSRDAIRNMTIGELDKKLEPAVNPWVNLDKFPDKPSVKKEPEAEEAL